MQTEERTKPLVLVADDDADLLRLVELQLESEFDLIKTGNGIECLRLARAHLPDAILLDMRLPEMTGREVLEALLDDSQTKKIPVVCLSVMSEIEDRVRGLESGAVDYIIKPADKRELAARLRAAVRRRLGEEAKQLDTDGLTGLFGRTGFEARLREEVHRSRRNSVTFSILIIDVDDMAALNEHASADGGDRMLHRMAVVLRRNLRGSDVLFRYGGDEFSVVLPDTDAGTAWVAAERLREAAGHMEHGHATTVSIGVAEFSSGHGVDELIGKAEVALIRAKESGGNMSWRADDPRRRAINPMSLSEELTGREWDVLAHLAQRRTEHEIAKRLGISAGTVRSHKARIRRKLHVAPELRLADFVRENFQDLSARLTTTEAWRR
ncbi:MAG: diguanylate cyclase [Actinomycetota bacterium]